MSNCKYLKLYIFFTLSLIFSSSAFASKKNEIVLQFTGDIFLGNWAVEFMEKYDYHYPFNGCAELFAEADVVVGNLETPLTESGEPLVDKKYLLKSPPAVATGLKEAGFKVVNLANNHILDYGFEGLNNTVTNLKESGIKHFGAGNNLEEALEPAILEVKGKKVAFLGYSATFPEEYWASDSTGGTAFPREKDLVKAVSKAVRENDIVVVSFHWGAELMQTPKDYQVDLAHMCVDLGADLVIGHHPHVNQQAEVYENVPIFYSLGNFAFASYSENAKTGLVIEARFKEDKLESAQVIPVKVYNQEVNFSPVPLDEKSAQDEINFLNALESEWIIKPAVIDKKGFIKFK